MNLWHIFKKYRRFIHCHLQHISNVLAFVAHFQCLSVVALSLAHFTRNIDVRQEMHFNFNQAVTGTRFTASAFDIERKPSGSICAHLCVLRLREQRANIIEQTGIRRRIGTRCATNRRLINGDDLVQMFQTKDFIESTRLAFCTVEICRQLFI